MEKFFQKKINLCVCAVFCCALWGSAFPIIKIGYKLLDISSLDVASQILFAGIRFTLAGALTVIFGGIFSKKALIVKPKNIKYVAVLALFQTVLQYVFFYMGLANSAGTKSSVIDSTSVFFAVIISCIILKNEKFTFRKAIGCILGFLGVLLINSGSSQYGAFTFTGDGFILLSAFSYAVSSVMIKKYSKYENPVALSGFQFMLGGAVMTAASLLFGGHISFNAKGLLALLYLSFLSAAAYTLWGILLKYNDVSKVAVYGFMTPVFGCLLSAIALKESLGQSAIIVISSLVLVCCGIFTVNFKQKQIN